MNQHINPPIGSDQKEPLILVRQDGEHDQSRLLTIVIASYNHHKYLGEAFSSIVDSKVCHRLSLIFIDDGSPDETLDFAKSYAFPPSLHVRIFGKQNAGLRDSLARGLAMADTPFVGFIASDDHYDSIGLSAAIAMLENQDHSDICWVFQAAYLEGRDGELVYNPDWASLFASEPAARERALSVEFPKPLLLQSTIFGTRLLRRSGAWQDGLTLDDWPTFVKIAQMAHDPAIDMKAVLEVVLCHYRVHSGGAHNNTARQLKICLEVAESGVNPEFRREAMSNVYSDVALMHLHEKELRSAASLFAKACVTNPRISTVLRPLARIVLSISRRLQKHASI